MIRRLATTSLAAAAAVTLSACGYFMFKRTDDPAPASRQAGEEGGEAVSGQGEEWVPPDMPSAEEAAAAAAAAQAKAETGVVYAGYDKKGGALTMKVGETLRIELKSIPTAGYVWNLKAKPDFLEPAGESTRGTDPARQNLPGFTGGNHYLGFDFVATAPGTGTFRLEEGRPWESDEPPTDTYDLTVTVTE